MKYTIEVKRPVEIEPELFENLLKDYFRLKEKNVIGNWPLKFNVYETATERFHDLTKCSNPEAKCFNVSGHTDKIHASLLKYDISAKGDLYYFLIDVWEEDLHYMNNGRGAFLPRILCMDKKEMWFTLYDNRVLDPEIFTLDYIKKGGY